MAKASNGKKFNPLQFLSFKGPYRILHMTWFAFFLTFMISRQTIGGMKLDFAGVREATA